MLRCHLDKQNLSVFRAANLLLLVLLDPAMSPLSPLVAANSNPPGVQTPRQTKHSAQGRTHFPKPPKLDVQRGTGGLDIRETRNRKAIGSDPWPLTPQMPPRDRFQASHCSSGMDLMWTSYFTHGTRNRTNIKALRLLGCGGPTLP